MIELVENIAGCLNGVRLSCSGSIVEITLYGAHITRYATKNSKSGALEDVIFLSKKAYLDGTKAIRGGVPLVFPMFGAGDGTLPSHGFARISTWKLTKVSEVEDKKCQATFCLADSEATRAKWPYSFLLEYVVTLFADNAITTQLLIRNNGSSEFKCQALLHSYYLIQDIHQCKLKGLKTLGEIDQLKGDKAPSKTYAEEWLSFDKETDSIFCGGADDSEFLIAGVNENKDEIHILKKSYLIENDAIKSIGSTDAVVWNPWIEKSKKMAADFEESEYLQMLCVEPGIVSKFETVPPGAALSLEQAIKVHRHN